MNPFLKDKDGYFALKTQLNIQTPSVITLLVHQNLTSATFFESQNATKVDTVKQETVWKLKNLETSKSAFEVSNINMDETF